MAIRYIIIIWITININILKFLPYQLTHPITHQKQGNQFSHVKLMAKGPKELGKSLRNWETHLYKGLRDL